MSNWKYSCPRAPDAPVPDGEPPPSGGASPGPPAGFRSAALPGRSGLLGAGLGEWAGRPQVGAGAVVVEDAQDLRGFLPYAERMRLHRGELGRLAGSDEDGPLA